MNEEREDCRVITIEEGEHVSEAILRTIAELSDRPILELTPLAEAIDPDTLDQMFAFSTPPDSLQFNYEGYAISLESDQLCVRKQQ